ncbi:unnamed protein product [Microthlaspi erraticum]|uniref:Uncharacterized protein n=1 Tax=Microthlaspi erraticum TaxID=1685480 RepID=A0A6D2KWD9_9BRAS|nr:unnamed protein product [Microthlaspi erraticum]
MSEKEKSVAVNKEGPSSQKSPQDEVTILVGTWVRETTGAWVFETDTHEGSGSINLSDDLKFRDLVDEVRIKLQIKADNVSIKLGYQYPQWMAIDDGDGSTPQYITDDQEVQFFIQMRRQIEEVNLCVTITAHVNGVPTIPTCNRKMMEHSPETEDIQSSNAADNGGNSEDEWHKFAISETPMTFPAFGSSQLIDLPPKHRHRVQSKAKGVSINEGASAIRLRSPTIAAADKGKGIVTDYGSSSDSDDDDAAVVPSLPSKVPKVHLNNNNVEVRRSLFQDGENSHMGPDNEADSEDDDEKSDYEPEQGRRFSRWGRFEDALHQILNDFSTEPALFGRDAPPVFTTTEGDGKHLTNLKDGNYQYIENN